MKDLSVYSSDQIGEDYGAMAVGCRKKFKVLLVCILPLSVLGPGMFSGDNLQNRAGCSGGSQLIIVTIPHHLSVRKSLSK